MPRLGTLRAGLAVAALWSGLAAPAHARIWTAQPGTTEAATALANAASGDTIVLAAGVHRGPLRIARRLTLKGAPGAILDGGGAGTVLTVNAPGATVESLTVRRSGTLVLTLDAGVHVQAASGAAFRGLVLREVLYGIAVERCDSVTIEGCDLEGRVVPSAVAAPAMDEAGGNGVHLWYSRDARVLGNRIARFMDGVYLSFANGTRIEENVLAGNGRYGLHTMYCQENRFVRNRFARNIAGCAIMFSNGLDVRDNDFTHNRGSRTYGMLLRDCSDGTFAGNRMIDNTIAVFMDNSNRNRFRENLVQDNGWGVILFSSCAGNEFAGNDFINNDYPVALDMRISDNRFDDGRRGNYWSGSAPYDLDADGVSDVPYSPVSAFAFLSKQYPDLAILGQSPAVLALTVAERTIPALRPSEAIDRFPLVTPAGRRVHGAALPDTADAPVGGSRGVPVAAAGFLALAATGLFGLARGRGPR